MKNKTQKILDRDGCIVVNSRDSLQHARRKYLHNQHALGNLSLSHLSNNLLCYSVIYKKDEDIVFTSKGIPTHSMLFLTRMKTMQKLRKMASLLRK